MKFKVNFHTYIPSLVALAVVTFFHFIGIRYDLYNTFIWYDIPMHIMGGIWVAMSAHWFFKEIIPGKKFSFWELLGLFIISSFLVGVIWEIFEVVVNTPNPPPGFTYWSDTIKDICDDLIGGSIVFVVTHVSRVYKKIHNII